MGKGLQMEVVFLLLYLHFERVFEVPFSAIGAFYVEAKHGFNKMTPATFVADFLKTSVVLTAVVAPFSYAALWIIKRYYASSFYIYLWAFSSVFQVVLVIIFPIFIQPLFNKFEEMEESPLKGRIQELAERVGFRAKRVLVMDASRRSGHSNAYIIGLTAKDRRVVLFDTLLKEVNEDEIIAILCHEFGHWKHSHVLKMIVPALLIQLGYLYLLSVSLNSKVFGAVLPMEEGPLVIRLLVFFMLLGAVNVPIEILRNCLSRHYERQADGFAVEMGYGKELCSGLIKLCEKNNSNMDPDPLYALVSHTHPVVTERIALIEREMNKAK